MVRSSISADAKPNEFASSVRTFSTISKKNFRISNWMMIMIPDSGWFETASSTNWQICRTSSDLKRPWLYPFYWVQKNASVVFSFAFAWKASDTKKTGLTQSYASTKTFHSCPKCCWYLSLHRSISAHKHVPNLTSTIRKCSNMRHSVLHTDELQMIGLYFKYV